MTMMMRMMVKMAMVLLLLLPVILLFLLLFLLPFLVCYASAGRAKLPRSAADAAAGGSGAVMRRGGRTWDTARGCGVHTGGVHIWQLLSRCFVFRLVVTCIVLACVVLRCLVVSGLFLPCLVFSCLALSRLALPCLALPCPALPCRVRLLFLLLLSLLAHRKSFFLFFVQKTPPDCFVFRCYRFRNVALLFFFSFRRALLVQQSILVQQSVPFVPGLPE